MRSGGLDVPGDVTGQFAPLPPEGWVLSRASEGCDGGGWEEGAVA
jgi:hypothetical protein